jgi:hypothetical protein
MPDANQIRITVHEGNIKAIPIRLRVKGTKLYWDVSAALQIKLEYEKGLGGEQAAVVCDENHPLADWSQGKVIVVVSPADVTAEVGSYPFSLTVFNGSEQVTAVTGHIEVLERPGFPEPPP